MSNLKAIKRENSSTGSNNKLRATGLIPAILYGGKDPNQKISKLLDDNSANILSFIRYEVGEGIEVEKVDFASEVMSQIES